MPFDESRRQRETGEIDHTRVLGGNATRWPCGVDAIADDPHRPSLVHGLAVEHPRRAQHDRGRFRGARLSSDDSRGEADDEQHGQLSSHHTRIVSLTLHIPHVQFTLHFPTLNLLSTFHFPLSTFHVLFHFSTFPLFHFPSSVLFRGTRGPRTDHL